jgi:hypothetical protein
MPPARISTSAGSARVEITTMVTSSQTVLLGMTIGWTQTRRDVSGSGLPDVYEDQRVSTTVQGTCPLPSDLCRHSILIRCPGLSVNCTLPHYFALGTQPTSYLSSTHPLYRYILFGPSTSFITPTSIVCRHLHHEQPLTPIVAPLSSLSLLANPILSSIRVSTTSLCSS